MIQHRTRSKRSKKPLLVLGIILVLAAGGIGAWALLRQDTAQNPTAEQSARQDKLAHKHPDRIRLIASGDVVAHDSVNLNAKRADGSYDYYPLMDELAPVFVGADIRFCNQVTPAGGTELGVTGYPKFNAPTELVRDLGKLGCNLVNTASNHSFDTSQQAITANVAAWEDVPDTLAVAGQNRSAAERDAVAVFEVKGVRFAFVAYTTYVNAIAPAQNDFGVNQYSRVVAERQITEAKSKGAEIIIASMRWGTEYSPSVNAQQEAEAQFLADQGVDVILGHGPHVLQPVEKLLQPDGTETIVWYSLANFLNTQLEPEALFNGIAVMDFNRSTKELESVGFLPVYSSYSWTAQQAASENLLSRQNVEMYVIDDVTPEVIAANQLSTTKEAQVSRIRETLTSRMPLLLLTKAQYLE